MEIYTMTRPSALPAVCAPVSAGYVLAAAAVAPRPQAHQVQVQAELVRVLPRVEITGFGGAITSNGTSGFVGSKAIVKTAKQRLTDGARGVPPRGRPV